MKFLHYALIIVPLFLALFWWGESFSFPILCNTRGCVTHRQLVQERVYATAFAQETDSSEPAEEAMLTTLWRRHLISSNKANIAISAKDAVAYRQSILHFTDEEKLQDLGFSSFAEYDEKVTIPFLMQAAYMEDNNIEETKDAYKELSKKMLIVSLLPKYTWDKETAQIVGR